MNKKHLAIYSKIQLQKVMTSTTVEIKFDEPDINGMDSSVWEFITLKAAAKFITSITEKSLPPLTITIRSNDET